MGSMLYGGEGINTLETFIFTIWLLLYGDLEVEMGLSEADKRRERVDFWGASIEIQITFSVTEIDSFIHFCVWFINFTPSGRLFDEWKSSLSRLLGHD